VDLPWLLRSGYGKGEPMTREYDIFERFPDGSTIWKDVVVGLEAARVKANAFALLSPNEFFAIHMPTNEIAVRMKMSLANA
jgi:hypothetical protein